MSDQWLVNQISETYVQGQRQAVIAVNAHLVNTYWKVGQYIVEFEQDGQDRAAYGSGPSRKPVEGSVVATRERV